MPLIHEQFATAAAGAGGVTFIAGDQRHRVGWGTIHADARRLAGGLQGLGVGPGHHVAFLAGTGRSTVTALQAVWLAGGSISFLQSPTRGADTLGFIAETARAIVLSDAATVIVGSPYSDLGMAPALQSALTTEVRVTPLAELADGAPANPWVPPNLTDDSPALRQLTSGSTSAPKAASITHGNLAANLAAMRVASDHDRIHELIVSWLPLNHDMGLIAFLTLPMAHGCELVLSDPADFLARPGSWLGTISEFGGTVTAAPNFAYAIATRLLLNGPRLDLSRLQCLISGGEPIDPAVVESFIAAAEPHGLRRQAFVPAFGMAEATLSVSLGRPGAGLRTDVVDAEMMATRSVAVPALAGRDSRSFALLGPPVPGVDVRIVGVDSRIVCGNREVGEVEIKGPSVTAGYHGDPAVNRERFHDGWFKTGDLGYFVDEDLVVCGRLKDVIIIGGRNIFPEDVERAASRAPGVRQGNIVAVGVTVLGAERLAIVAESRNSDSDEVGRAIGKLVSSSTGLVAHRICIVPPGSIPKTTSGKLRRTETARLLTGGCFDRPETGEAVPASPQTLRAG